MLKTKFKKGQLVVCTINRSFGCWSISENQIMQVISPKRTSHDGTIICDQYFRGNGKFIKESKLRSLQGKEKFVAKQIWEQHPYSKSFIPK